MLNVHAMNGHIRMYWMYGHMHSMVGEVGPRA